MYRSNVFKLISSYRLNRQCLIKAQCLTDKWMNKKMNYCSLIKKHPNDFEVKESEDLNFNYQTLNIPEVLKMNQLTNLFLREKLTPLKKPGSFMVDLFIGKLDTDFLFYPKLITTRKEYLQLNIQNAMIERNFRDTISQKDGYELLKDYGFLNIWKLSTTEQCSIFESMGASMCKDLLYKQLLNSNSEELKSTNLMKIYDSNYKNQFTKLVFHNLVGSCLMFADQNKEIVQKYKQLMDQGAKIGFAFNETEQKMGSLPFSDWTTTAELSLDKNHWILKGEKNKLLNDDYDHYIVFARTNQYPEDEKANYKTRYEEPFDGIVCLLVDKNQLNISEDKENNLDDKEFKYQKINLDYVKIARENELFEAEEYGGSALSCRGLGILLTTSYQLGILKSLQRQFYKFLTENKSPFLNCKATQIQLVSLTDINYTIESMTYLIAAMYDSFDIKSFPDMTLETSILKSFTVEQSRQFLVKLQSLFGSKLFNVSKYHDLINLYDSLFDSSMHHRLFTGSTGAHHVGVYKVNDVIQSNLPFVYPSFQLWHKFKMSRNELDNPILDHDASGHLHVKLSDEGDKLEYMLKRLEYGIYKSVSTFKKDINEEQHILLIISDVASHVFALLSVLSRASRSEIEGVQNSEQEIYIARQATRNRINQVKYLIERIEDVNTFFYENSYDSQIHKRNLKYDGYFPYSPIETTY